MVMFDDCCVWPFRKDSGFIKQQDGCPAPEERADSPATTLAAGASNEEPLQ